VYLSMGRPTKSPKPSVHLCNRLFCFAPRSPFWMAVVKTSSKSDVDLDHDSHSAFAFCGAIPTPSGLAKKASVHHLCICALLRSNIFESIAEIGHIVADAIFSESSDFLRRFQIFPLQGRAQVHSRCTDAFFARSDAL